MWEGFQGPSYGPELFLEFVPGTVRHRSEPLGVAALSGAVVAEMSGALGGPCLEVSWPGRTVFSGLVRAVRHVDGILAVSLPAGRPGVGEDRGRVSEVLLQASEAGFDRPLILVSRAPRLADLDDGGIDRMAEWIGHEVEQGFTSISFRPQDIAVDRAERMAAVAEELVGLGVGVEVELDRTPEGGFILSELEEEGVPLAAVRGAQEGDDVGTGLLVIDPLQDAIPEDQPCRVMLDGFVLKGILKALPAAEAETILGEAGGDVTAALVRAGAFLEECDEAVRTRAEAHTYVNVQAAAKSLGADGTASELLDALAAHLFG